jgi:hypothetical protein
MFIVLAVGFTDFHFDYLFQKAELFNRGDFPHLIILLKFSLDLLVIFESQEILKDSKIFKLVVT